MQDRSEALLRQVISLCNTLSQGGVAESSGQLTKDATSIYKYWVGFDLKLLTLEIFWHC